MVRWCTPSPSSIHPMTDADFVIHDPLLVATRYFGHRLVKVQKASPPPQNHVQLDRTGQTNQSQTVYSSFQSLHTTLVSLSSPETAWATTYCSYQLKGVSNGLEGALN